MCTHRSMLEERRSRPPSGPGAPACAGARGDTHTQAGSTAEESSTYLGLCQKAPSLSHLCLCLGSTRTWRRRGQCLWNPSLWWFEQNGPQMVHMSECSVPHWWTPKDEECGHVGGGVALQVGFEVLKPHTIPAGSLSFCLLLSV